MRPGGCRKKSHEFPPMTWMMIFINRNSVRGLWKNPFFQEISNRTHGPRTPKPEYLIARSQLTQGSVGIRSHSIFDGISYGFPSLEVGPDHPQLLGEFLD